MQCCFTKMGKPNQLGKLSRHRAQAVLDVGERRVDLVHHPRHHLPEGGHLFRLDQLGFGFLQLGERLGQLVHRFLEAALVEQAATDHLGGTVSERGIRRSQAEAIHGLSMQAHLTVGHGEIVMALGVSGKLGFDPPLELGQQRPQVEAHRLRAADRHLDPAFARSLGRQVDELTVVVLDRPRHEKLIADIRATGARIRLIGDGDLSAGISAAVSGTGVHAVMGTGGAPEGVLTAAAMRCLGGEIYARLVVAKPEDEERCRKMGISDFRRIYSASDLASGKSITFAATGVTDGALMKGVRFFGHGTRTSSIVMQNEPHQIRFIDTIHVTDSGDDLRIRF